MRISQAGGGLPAWTGDGRVIYRAGSRIVAATLVTSGGATTVGRRSVIYAGTLAPADAFMTFDIARDGQSLILFATDTSRLPEVVVGVNWRQAVLEPQLKQAGRSARGR